MKINLRFLRAGPLLAFLAVGGGLLAPTAASAAASTTTFHVNQTFAGHMYDSTAVFVDDGLGNFHVTLTNGGAPASINQHVLSGLFWAQAGTLTKVAGAAGAFPTVGLNTVRTDDGTAGGALYTGGQSLDQHAAYKANPLTGYTQGVGMSGFGGTFGNPNVWTAGGTSPLLGNSDWGLISQYAAGGVGGGEDPFILNSATFKFTYDPNAGTLGSISQVRFQYGSSLTKPCFIVSGEPPNFVPEDPGNLMMLGGLLPMAGLVLRGRRWPWSRSI